MRSLCFTDKPDFLIGNSYGKYIQRDDTPPTSKRSKYR
jgi:hypothetical protein